MSNPGGRRYQPRGVPGDRRYQPHGGAPIRVRRETERLPRAAPNGAAAAAAAAGIRAQREPAGLAGGGRDDRQRRPAARQLAFTDDMTTVWRSRKKIDTTLPDPLPTTHEGLFTAFKTKFAGTLFRHSEESAIFVPVGQFYIKVRRNKDRSAWQLESPNEQTVVANKNPAAKNASLFQMEQVSGDQFANRDTYNYYKVEHQMGTPQQSSFTLYSSVMRAAFVDVCA